MEITPTLSVDVAAATAIVVNFSGLVVRMPEILATSQDNVSRIEKRSDILLSTLRSYVEAMDGELDPVVKSPDHAPVKWGASVAVLP